MCDLRPGDEVICIEGGDWLRRAPRWMFWTRMRPASGPVKGHHYIVRRVGLGISEYSNTQVVAIELEGPWMCGWHVSRFRKVQRRNLTAWLATQNTIEEPKRKKVDA